jgi:hypothetical protein
LDCPHIMPPSLPRELLVEGWREGRRYSTLLPHWWGRHAHKTLSDRQKTGPKMKPRAQRKWKMAPKMGRVTR